MMEQLPLWMQYVIVFVLGGIAVALCFIAWERYVDWDCDRQSKERQLNYDRGGMIRLKEKMYRLEEIHDKEILRYENRRLKEVGRLQCRKEKGQCH
jgi:hypothetical protein